MNTFIVHDEYWRFVTAKQEFTEDYGEALEFTKGFNAVIFAERMKERHPYRTFWVVEGYGLDSQRTISLI